MKSMLACLRVAHLFMACPWALPDRWITLPNYGLPGQRVHLEEWDGEKNLYVAGLDGIFILENGMFRKLPAPEDTLRMLSIEVRSPEEYWVMKGYSPAPTPWGVFHVLYHYKAGIWARYDTTNSCLKGNTWKLLGTDSIGRAIVDTRNFYGMGGPSLGVFRIDGDDCREIPLDVKGTETGATQYFRDSRGREYFAMRDMSDVPICHGFVRLSPEVEKFPERFCVLSFEEAGDSLFLATTGGLGILTGSRVTHITQVLGIDFPEAQDVLRDTQGYTWIATEGYDFFPKNLGLVRIKGKDTTVMNQTNSGFPSLFASRLEEDRSGNLWVNLGHGGQAIYLRDGNPLPVGIRSQARPHLPAQSRTAARNLLGRKYRREATTPNRR